MSSLLSANGPSTTVRFVSENFTRAPLELGCRPSAASRTPAFTSSSLYLPIASSSSVLGNWPASLSALALTITRKRMRGTGLREEGRGSGVSGLASTLTSNGGSPNRHSRESLGKSFQPLWRRTPSRTGLGCVRHGVSRDQRRLGAPRRPRPKNPQRSPTMLVASSTRLSPELLDASFNWLDSALHSDTRAAGAAVIRRLRAIV